MTIRELRAKLVRYDGETEVLMASRALMNWEFPVGEIISGWWDGEQFFEEWFPGAWKAVCLYADDEPKR